MKLTKKLDILLANHLLRNDDQAASICEQAIQRINELEATVRHLHDVIDQELYNE